MYVTLSLNNDRYCLKKVIKIKMNGFLYLKKHIKYIFVGTILATTYTFKPFTYYKWLIFEFKTLCDDW